MYSKLEYNFLLLFISHRVADNAIYFELTQVGSSHIDLKKGEDASARGWGLPVCRSDAHRSPSDSIQADKVETSFKALA
jgi:hypothetical protein